MLEKEAIPKERGKARMNPVVLDRSLTYQCGVIVYYHTHTHTYLALSIEGARNKDNPAAMNTLAQILVSKTLLQERKKKTN